MAPNPVEKTADVLHLPGVHKREEDYAEAASEGDTKKPIFEKEKVTVIFVLGGPGAGVSLSFSFLPSPHTSHHANSSSSSATYVL